MNDAKVTLPPSRFILPQHASADRARGRRATLQAIRSEYVWCDDPPVEHEGERYSLPSRISELPKGERFSTAKALSFWRCKQTIKVNKWLTQITRPKLRRRNFLDYASLLGFIAPPKWTFANWHHDHHFARRRLCGVNPMQLQRLDTTRTPVPVRLLERSDDALRRLGYPKPMSTLRREGRVFVTDYRGLASSMIQRHVLPGHRVAAGMALFYTDDDGRLHPLTISLDPMGEEVISVCDDRWTWQTARVHIESADAHYHEGVKHLLDTHLVSEVFCVATARNLHPDHPVNQLLRPHFRFNLAMDTTARGNLLSPGGPIDVAMGAGVNGVLNLIRMEWKRWRWPEQGAMAHFERHGLDDTNVLRNYWYRDDARVLHHAIQTYVESLVALFYRNECEASGSDPVVANPVQADTELQAWAKELSERVPGFPVTIESTSELSEILTEVIFRASVGHAAVNNGQFDCYGWIPNAPGAVRQLPEHAHGLRPDEPMREADFWRCLPDTRRAHAQIGMTWVLSAPTEASLLRTGEAEAFAPSLRPEAARIVGLFRRRMHEISGEIDERNAQLLAKGEQPYTYLDPRNVSRSVEV